MLFVPAGAILLGALNRLEIAVLAEFILAVHPDELSILLHRSVFLLSLFVGARLPRLVPSAVLFVPCLLHLLHLVQLLNRRQHGLDAVLQLENGPFVFFDDSILLFHPVLHRLLLLRQLPDLLVRLLQFLFSRCELGELGKCLFPFALGHFFFRDEDVVILFDGPGLPTHADRRLIISQRNLV